jgi:hypothetical protein
MDQKIQMGTRFQRMDTTGRPSMLVVCRPGAILEKLDQEPRSATDGFNVRKGYLGLSPGPIRESKHILLGPSSPDHATN